MSRLDSLGLDMSMNIMKLTKEKRMKKHIIDGEDGELQISNFAKIQGFLDSEAQDSIESELNSRFKKMLAECDDDNSSNKVYKLK